VTFRAWNDCTQDQKIERWENVLRVLTAMTPHQRKKHFNMGTWAEQTDCGTVGCAAGLCSFDTWFRRRGFKSAFREYHDLDDSGKEVTILTHYFADALPEDFFGMDGYHGIFVNDEFTVHAGSGVHRSVVKAVKDYIKELQSEAV
jgi:hypothetical protein